jgi:hypothetical protein
MGDVSNMRLDDALGFPDLPLTQPCRRGQMHIGREPEFCFAVRV